MKYILSNHVVESDFVKEVATRSGQNIYNCYQCGKCSAGCPINYQMDYQPNQIMRMIQLGLKEEVLNSKAIWLCISCHTCSTRCPRENEMDRVMDALRSMAYARENNSLFDFKKFLKDLSSRAYRGLLETLEMGIRWNARVFNAVFLENVRRHGRSFDIALVSGLNTGSGFLFRNILKAPILLLKGKLGFFPHKTKATTRLREIYQKVEEIEKTRI